MPIDARTREVAHARRKRAGRFADAHKYIPLVGFVTPDFHILITSSGDLLAAYETEGLDSSCLSEEVLGEHHRILTLAINEADPRLCVHQYYFKDQATFKARRGGYREEVVTAIDQARERALEKVTYFGTRIIYVLEWKTNFVAETNLLGKLTPILKDGLQAPFSAQAREAFLTRIRVLLGDDQASVRIPERRLLQEISAFSDTAEAFIARMARINLAEGVDSSIAEGVGPASLSFEKITGNEAFGFYSRLWNWEPEVVENAFLPSPTYLAHWLACSEVDFADPRVVWSGRVPLHLYTVRGFRDPVDLDVMRHLRNHPARMVIHTRFAQMSGDESSRFLARKISAAHNLGGFSKGDPLKTKRIEDLRIAMDESVRGRPFGKYNCTIALAGDDLRQLDDHSRTFERIAAQHGVVLRREGMSKDFAFLTLFPGNHAYEFVTRTGQSNMATAAYMPYRLAEGRGLKPPRGSCFPEALCVLNAYTPETGMGAPVNFWINAQDLAHFAIFGGSGKGKSFTVNAFVTNWGRYAGTPGQPKGLRRWIIDRGHSYRSLCDLLDGAYINVGDPATRAVMNPFDLSPDGLRTNVANLVQFVGMLMAATSSVEVHLTELDARALSDAIMQMAKDIQDTGRIGSLEFLSQYLGGFPDLVARLSPWIPGIGGIGGQFAHLFPAERDGFSQSDFTVFNFSDEFVSAATMGPIFFYIVMKIQASIVDERIRGHYKLLFLDEAAVFLTPVRGDWKSERITATIRAFLRKALKEWRKFNGAAGLATQEPRDFCFDPEFFESFRALVPTRIYLAQPKTEALVDLDKGLGLDTHLARSLNDLPKGVFLVDQRGMKRYLQLSVDPTSYAIYTTDPNESAFRADYLRTFPPGQHPKGVYGAYEALGGEIQKAKESGNPVAYFQRRKVELQATAAEPMGAVV